MKSIAEEKGKPRFLRVSNLALAGQVTDEVRS